MNSPADAVELLVALGRSLGIAPEQLASAEDPFQLRFSAEALPASQLAHIDEAILARAIEAFSGSLRLRIHAGGLSILEAQDELDPQQFRETEHEIARQSVLGIELQVNKPALLRQWHEHLPDGPVRLFLFASEFASRLTSCLPQPHTATSLFWEEADLLSHCTVVVADAQLLCRGTLLTIAGYEAWPPPPENSDITSDAPTAHRMALHAREVHGPQAWTIGVTPLHFATRCARPDSAGISVALQTLAANLSACYLATRVDQAGASWIAHFASERGRVELALIATPPSDIDLTSSGHSLVELCCWAYAKPHQRDRLRIIQACLIRALSDRSPSTTKILLEHAVGIKEASNWALQSFIEERLARYSEEERDLHNQVATMVDSLEGQISELVSGLSNAVLAAVAALIGSMLASLFGDNFSPDVLRIGLYAYAAYLLLFPGVVSLLHQWTRFRSTWDIFEDRKRRFAAALGHARVREAVGNRQRAVRRRFVTSFALSAVVVLIVLGACLAGARILPEIVSSGT